MATFVDAERAVADWISAQTDTLTGVGNPLVKGAHLTPLTGAANVPYALLSVIGGSTAFGAENLDHRARISAAVYGPTKGVATAAAVALANALAELKGSPVAMNGATGLLVDSGSISGPSWLPDGAGPRLIVDFDIYLRAA